MRRWFEYAQEEVDAFDMAVVWDIENARHDAYQEFKELMRACGANALAPSLASHRIAELFPFWGDGGGDVREQPGELDLLLAAESSAVVPSAITQGRLRQIRPQWFEAEVSA